MRSKFAVIAEYVQLLATTITGQKPGHDRGDERSLRNQSLERVSTGYPHCGWEGSIAEDRPRPHNRGKGEIGEDDGTDRSSE